MTHRLSRRAVFVGLFLSWGGMVSLLVVMGHLSLAWALMETTAIRIVPSEPNRGNFLVVHRADGSAWPECRAEATELRVDFDDPGKVFPLTGMLRGVLDETQMRQWLDEAEQQKDPLSLIYFVAANGRCYVESIFVSEERYRKGGFGFQWYLYERVPGL